MKLQEIVNEHNREPTRVQCRQILRRWGCVSETCRLKTEEMTEFSSRIKETAGLIASSTGGDHVDGGETPDPTACAVQRLHGLSKEYQRVVDECAEDIDKELRFKEVIDEATSDISQTAKQILVYRYQKKWGWTMIGLKMHMSEENVRYIERGAVEHLMDQIFVESKV